MNQLRFMGLLASILLYSATHIFCTSHHSLKDLNAEAELLFGYKMSIELIHQDFESEEVLVTCHGFGANKDIGYLVAQQVDLPVITFNFPDYDFDHKSDIHATSFGTINEYLPLIYLLKALVNKGILTIHLYGFSAGGGALIATLAVLATTEYEHEIRHIGVQKEDVSAIGRALSRGMLILDAPLKSVHELLDYRPHELLLQGLAARYKKNQFEPIDCIEKLRGLALSILLYFEEPDEVLSNRDDLLFYRRLCAANSRGSTKLVRGSDGGHNGLHKKLWEAYRSHPLNKNTPVIY